MTVSFAARSEEQALRSLWIVRENIYVRVHVGYVCVQTECMLIYFFLFFFHFL